MISAELLNEVLTEIFVKQDESIEEFSRGGNPNPLTHQILVRMFKKLKETEVESPSQAQVELALAILEDELPIHIWRSGYGVWLEPEYEGATRCVAHSLQDVLVMAAGEVE